TWLSGGGSTCTRRLLGAGSFPARFLNSFPWCGSENLAIRCTESNSRPEVPLRHRRSRCIHTEALGVLDAPGHFVEPAKETTDGDPVSRVALPGRRLQRPKIIASNRGRPANAV